MAFLTLRRGLNQDLYLEVAEISRVHEEIDRQISSIYE
jgi:hypothetical protein